MSSFKSAGLEQQSLTVYSGLPAPGGAQTQHCRAHSEY